MRIEKSRYANDRHLRKNPFWSTICDLLPKHGFHWFYGESGNTCHVFFTVFDPKIGKEKDIKYAFARTAVLNSTVPNFKSSFGRFLREQVLQNWGLLPPDPDKHVPHVDDKNKSVSFAKAEALFSKAMATPPPAPTPTPRPAQTLLAAMIEHVDIEAVIEAVAPPAVIEAASIPAPIPAPVVPIVAPEPRENKMETKPEQRVVVAFSVPASEVGAFITANAGLADLLYAKQLREATEPPPAPVPAPKPVPSVATTVEPDVSVAVMPAAYPRRHRFVDGKRLDEKILDVMRKQPGVIFTADSVAHMVSGYDPRSYASTLSRLYREGLLRKAGVGQRTGKYLIAKPR